MTNNMKIENFRVTPASALLISKKVFLKDLPECIFEIAKKSLYQGPFINQNQECA